MVYTTAHRMIDKGTYGHKNHFLRHLELPKTASGDSSRHGMMAVWERKAGTPEAFEPAVGMADHEVEEFINEGLREFPAQVAGEQAESFSAEDHYDLGIAYKTMGLLDKAVSEFLFAMNGTERFTDALLMLALCSEEGENA